ncbi:TVP38/TMEM64 family protein [Nanoarchaeota archaeon]
MWNKERFKSIFGIFLIIISFMVISYLVQTNTDLFKQYLDVGLLGMIVFVFILALSIIVAPISAVSLFPLASSLWGWVLAGVLGTIGWTIGAVVAFMLARKYGVTLVEKVLPSKKIYRFEKVISGRNLFWTVIVLRMFIPVDGVSYLMGLFSKMSLKSYTLATVIGLVVFSFAVAYLGSVPFYYQLFFAVIFLFLFLIWLVIHPVHLSKKSVQ